MFKVGQTRLDGGLDIFNSRNQNAVAAEPELRSSLGAPQQISQGRLLRISAQVKFQIGRFFRTGGRPPQ